MFDPARITDDMKEWFVTRGRCLEVCFGSDNMHFAQIDIPFDADAAVELRVAWNAGIIEMNDGPEPIRVTYQGGSMWALPASLTASAPGEPGGAA
jgi:hypothetical protein